MTQAPVVQVIDHLVVMSPDPDALFRFLAHELRLPVAWPLRTFSPARPYPVGPLWDLLGPSDFTSGAIWVGRHVLEIAGLPGPVRAGVSGIAFQPFRGLEAALAALDARRIPHTPAYAYRERTQPPHTAPWWQVAGIRMPVRGPEVFLCQFNLRAASGPLEEYLKHRRKGSSPANPPGICGLAEVALGARDAEAAAVAWDRLLETQPASQEAQREVDGVAIRVSRSQDDGVQHLVLGVLSLAAALEAVPPGCVRVSEDEVQLDPDGILGTPVYLREQCPA